MIFAAILMAATFFTGLIWTLDKLVWGKKNPGKKQNVIIEYSKSFFPILLLVFVIRTFIVEPFKIPSGSMMPTLIAGDFIAVNKFSYGLRLPVFNIQLVPVGLPQRGEVFVFHYPVDPSIDYIKRVIGLPGDDIRYENKQLTINGEMIEQFFVGQYLYNINDYQIATADEYLVKHNDTEHSILLHDLPDRDFHFKVPEGHYLAIGDNRDNSSDSRVWGFVPEEYLVGKAWVIWLNFGEPSRIGNLIK